METESERIARQGRFAEMLLEQQEWSEVLNEVRDSVVGEWMQGATVEAREMAHAKIKALGQTHALVRTWKDRKDVQDMQAAQTSGTSAS